MPLKFGMPLLQPAGAGRRGWPVAPPPLPMPRLSATTEAVGRSATSVSGTDSTATAMALTSTLASASIPIILALLILLTGAMTTSARVGRKLIRYSPLRILLRIGGLMSDPTTAARRSDDAQA